MNAFTPTPQTFLIICPLVFLAGFVDAIGGGGGLISLPAFIFAGLPMHNAVATNKLSSALGTSVTTIRFIKNGLVDFKLGIPTMVAAVAGSSLGANLSLAVDEAVMEKILFVVLPVAAFIVLNKERFKESVEEKPVYDIKTIAVSCVFAFIIGVYDGLYGPGTGTFLIIAFNVFAGISVVRANAQTKLINLTTNITALTVFLLNGKIMFLPGLAGAACNMAGNYIGSGLAMKNGAKIVRPVILIVLALLLIKLIAGF